MKVDFIICGAQKGGTTALDAYLREHTQIGMANQKEVHFFDNEDHFHDGIPDYSAYHAAFSPTAEHRLLGEATPVYMYWRAAARRMWEYNPDLKIIVLLRNPIDRAYSHWNMERSRDMESESFRDALHNEMTRCRAALPLQHRVYSYVDRGFYSEQLRRLWSFFPKEQVLVLKSEDLKSHPQPTLDHICDFLGVDPMPQIAAKDIHSRVYSSKIDSADKKHLRVIFEHEIRNLERMLGWNCSHWLLD